MRFPFKKQMRVEVVDKTQLCRTRVALVQQVRAENTEVTEVTEEEETLELSHVTTVCFR